MAESNSIETPNIYPNLNAILLNDQQQFRLNQINEIKDYFVAEIKEREIMSKRVSKYIDSFDYFDKSLIVLSATSGSISIVFHCLQKFQKTLIITRNKKSITKLLCWPEVN